MNVARSIALNTSALAAIRVVVILGGIATITLASRYLGLEDYGAFISAMALVGLFEIATDFGVSTMAAREIARAPGDERRILGNVLGLSLTVSLAVLAVSLAVAQLAYAAEPQARTGAMILLAGLPLLAPIGSTRAHFVAAQRAWLSGLGEGIGVVVTVVGMVLAVVLDLGFAGLVAAVPAGRLAQAMLVVVLVRPDVRFAVGGELAYWRTLLIASIPLGLTRVVGIIYGRADALMLTALRSPADVALYGLAFRVVEALIAVPSFFMITLFPEIAREDADSDRLRSIMGQAIAVMELLALPLLVLLVALAPEVVTLVGGDAFAEAAGALQLLAPGLALSFGATVYGHALVALGRQGRVLRVTIATLLVNVVANVPGILLFGPYGAAAALSLAELANLLLLRREYLATGRPPINALRARMLAAAALMASVVALKLLVSLASVPALVLGATIGLGVYVAALVALRAVPAPIMDELVGPLLRAARRRRR